jgi:NAD+ synthase (glutamine-hydrolysing)
MALGQINTTVGDFKGNLKKVIDCLNMGRENNVDMVIFPELTTTGYPPEDLLLKPSFIEANVNMLKQVISSSNGIGCILDL